MGNNYPRKVNFSEYEHSFSYDLLKDFEEGRLDDFDIETMRGLIYGYTFTEDYAKGVIPETFSMEYWAEKKRCSQSREIRAPCFLAFLQMRPRTVDM